MVKIKKLILLLLLIPSAFAYEQTFPSPLSIILINDNSTSNITQVNLSIENFNRVFSCNATSSSNSYNVDIKRNVSETSAAFNNLTENLNDLTSTCSKITEQYGDINKYFSLYASCNTENELCKVSKTAAEQRAADLTPFKSNYDSCNTNLIAIQTENTRIGSEVIPAIEGNLTSCQGNLQKSNSIKFIWAIGGALLVAILWTVDKKKMNPPTSKSRTTGLGDRVGRG